MTAPVGRSWTRREIREAFTAAWTECAEKHTGALVNGPCDECCEKHTRLLHAAKTPTDDASSSTPHLYGVPEANGRCGTCGRHVLDPVHVSVHDLPATDDASPGPPPA